MSNVKPGDFAKMVLGNHPESRPNLNKQFYVIRPWICRCICGDLLWVCENLQPASLRYQGTWISPGREGTACDSTLRRIDPPADDIDTDVTQNLPEAVL